MTRIGSSSLVGSLFLLACAGNPTEATSLGSASATDTGPTDPSSPSDPSSDPSTDDDTQGTSDDGDPFAECGNNVIEGQEQCDLGEAQNGNGGPCRSDCRLNTCGDGYLGPNEGCDDGNAVPDDGCTDCAGVSCGDGDTDLDEGEQCDDANDNNADGCSNTCQLPSCGNMLLEGPEECEFGVPIELGCSDINMMFDAGELQCNRMCQFSTTACSDCGDGNVSGAEQCDGANLGGNTCMSLDFAGGALGCVADICELDTTGCTTCGNNVIDGAEPCDGTDLGGQTCLLLGQGDGALGCSGCQFDFSGCSSCGNNMVDMGEDCDGLMLPQSMCSQLPEQYDQGALMCMGCTYVTDACCFDDIGDACPGGDAECCGALDCDAVDAVCCTEALGVACPNDEACCGDRQCNETEGNVCCTERLGSACTDDDECCGGSLDCEGQACCTEIVNAQCNGAAPNNDNQCCDPMVCHDGQNRCCIPSGQSCTDGDTNDAWCCSGSCNNGTNNCD